MAIKWDWKDVLTVENKAEIRTGALLSQLQKKMEDLEKEREYDEIHFNPAVIPRDVSVNARCRLINEGECGRMGVDRC